jgi:hypothetical protein
VSLHLHVYMYIQSCTDTVHRQPCTYTVYIQPCTDTVYRQPCTYTVYTYILKAYGGR